MYFKSYSLPSILLEGTRGHSHYQMGQLNINKNENKNNSETVQLDLLHKHCVAFKKRTLHSTTDSKIHMSR